jgi:hypothetical protein
LIASWDGTTWSPLGNGIDGAGRNVLALTEFNGLLIAAGDFTTAGGLPASNVAAWDGTSWHALGAGVDGVVRSLIPFDGELIAGGLFTHAGGISASHIAAWNGTSWHALGAGVSTPAGVAGDLNEPEGIIATMIFEGDLVVGGSFSTAGGEVSAFWARWRSISCCGSADFNCDGDIGTDADIGAFFACLSGTCPLPPCTSTADFNGDGDIGTDADIEAFFRVLGGGAC